jgi:hypothetical protein
MSNSEELVALAKQIADQQAKNIEIATNINDIHDRIIKLKNVRARVKGTLDLLIAYENSANETPEKSDLYAVAAKGVYSMMARDVLTELTK